MNGVHQGTHTPAKPLLVRKTETHSSHDAISSLQSVKNCGYQPTPHIEARTIDPASEASQKLE